MADAADTALIEAVGLRKRYPQGEVLRGADLRVLPGELVALMGRSGSGKSTLLHLIGGLDREYEGRLRCGGKDLAALDDRALARYRNQEVGFVFQAFHLLDHLSCLENVMLPAAFSPATLPRAEAAARAREALERVGLGGRAADLPGALSGGQKQRVAIARALFFRPPLLLADEPTGNLDGRTGEEVIALFRELNRQGLTLLLVTHEARTSAAARRVLRLEDGVLVEDPPSSPPAPAAGGAP